MVKPYISEEVLLDPEVRSAEVLDFERRLLGKIVGQDRAVRRIVNMYQIYLAGMAMPNRPIGNLLFLGPTGSGKTRERGRSPPRRTPHRRRARPRPRSG